MPPSDSPVERTELLSRIRGAEAAITVLTDRVDAEFLAAAGPALKIVANYAVGFDNIDLPACRSRGVVVTNTPGVLTDATADLAWTLILATARRVTEGQILARGGRWQGITPTQLLGLQITGATLGIAGPGRIGTAVARRAAGFRMQVLYSGPRPSAEMDALPAQRVELPELLSRADVVSLHMPLRPENRHLIGPNELARMKATAILINTARGPLIDEAALVDVLRRGVIAGAGLDVYEHEPRLSAGLADLSNVVLLPHLGSATTATRTAMAHLAADNVIAVLSGRPALTPICG